MNQHQAFFTRIGLDPDTKIEYTTDFLGRVQTACVLSIAYENLDILAGKPILLTKEALYDKIVTRGRAAIASNSTVFSPIYFETWVLRFPNGLPVSCGESAKSPCAATG